MRNLGVKSGRPAAGSLRVESPFDGRELDTLPTINEQHVDDALAVAQQAFDRRDGWLTIPQRLEILDKTVTLMGEQVEELTLLAASEGGKPYTDSRVEVLRAIDGVKLCAETLRGHAGDVIALGTTPATGGRFGFTQKEPIGVVVAVSAFNHPLNLIVHQVMPAVATGCPVIVKPAGDTPLSCVRLLTILREAGLPEPWCQVAVTDSQDAAQQLVTDPRVSFFSFIGSARVGWMLRSKLAPGARCALEHGGVAPLIIAPPYNHEAAVAAILKGGFYHAGQVCVSVQRVYVPTHLLDAVAEAVADGAKQLNVGAPEDPATEVGPLIRPAEVSRVSDWVDEAVNTGATLLCGGKVLDNNCYAPTVLVNPPADAKVSTQEVFGPVVCFYGYDKREDAVASANSLPVAFQASVFSDDINIATELYRGLAASAVMINDHTAFRDDVMPFAGLRQSGMGIGGIPYTMEDMQIDKLMVIKQLSV